MRLGQVDNSQTTLGSYDSSTRSCERHALRRLNNHRLAILEGPLNGIVCSGRSPF
jgi:hypothetical protein